MEVGVGHGDRHNCFQDRFDSSALGGSNCHPREPLFLEPMIHLQVLCTKQLWGAELVTCALGHVPSERILCRTTVPCRQPLVFLTGSLSQCSLPSRKLGLRG